MARKPKFAGRLGAAVRSGQLSPAEARMIQDYSEAHQRLEDGTDPKRCLRVAKLWRREREREIDGRPRPHHSRFNPGIIESIEARIGDSKMILDPMAGTMERLRVLEDRDRGWHQVWGIEYEQEWVDGYPHTRLQQGDARKLPFPSEHFDAIVVSPSYGNRDSDRTGDWWDNADRKTYAAALGRNVSEGSLCVPFEDERYKTGHTLAWAESVRVLKTGGLFVINLKNHIKKGQIIRVSQWHRNVLRDVLGMEEIDDTSIATKGRLSGENYDVRAELVEKIYVYLKTPDSHQKAKAVKKSLKQKGKKVG